MRLRPYIPSHDFDAIKNWVTDERTNALWSAKHAPFPMERAAFDRFLADMYEKHGDCPFVAATDDGTVVGFICCGINTESNEAMLAFVLIDPMQRGKGYGKEMIELAAEYCLGIMKAEAVQLNVFTVNERARKCYESAGFTERHTTPDAFPCGDELWGRCNMVKRKK
ncbi:GNAT family N-acetyltransferase [uncultured Ruminococcus sp.]|uniref:GNAT family N-acetyltransferase n=1 Tax=uncultured Ruminococcus sp. TaxID=165186 RepID=UPI00261635E7|nr:GNAT family protein [uncultured Ruminococcus sp.]